MINLKQFQAWANKQNLNLLTSMNDFKEGDKVTYTNEFGASFANKIVAGFVQDSGLKDRHVFLLSDAYWFPVKFSEIKKQTFTLREYKQNEKHNDHTLNALKLIMQFGTTTELRKMKEIVSSHEQQGFLTVDQTRERLELSNKYYRLLE